jgi:prevent-host-death family protein
MNVPAEQITAQLHAADQGPVFITDKGRARYVLLSIDDYRRLSGRDRSIADLLAMPGVEDIDFEPPQLQDVAQAADLS